MLSNDCSSFLASASVSSCWWTATAGSSQELYIEEGYQDTVVAIRRSSGTPHRRRRHMWGRDIHSLAIAHPPLPPPPWWWQCCHPIPCRRGRLSAPPPPQLSRLSLTGFPALAPHVTSFHGTCYRKISHNVCYRRIPCNVALRPVLKVHDTCYRNIPCNAM